MKLILMICILTSVMFTLIYIIKKKGRTRSMLGITAVIFLMTALIINIL